VAPPAELSTVSARFAEAVRLAPASASVYRLVQPISVQRWRSTRLGPMHQGVVLDRSTLCERVGRACWWLAPFHELMMTTVLASPRIFADDTTLPVLDPGRGKTKTGRLWCCRR
jgi:hypothetical protein